MTTPLGRFEIRSVGTVTDSRGRSSNGSEQFLWKEYSYWLTLPDIGKGTKTTGTDYSTPVELLNVNGERRMRKHEAEFVRTVLEDLVAVAGWQNVPDDIDVEGATVLLNEVIYGDEKEGTDIAVAGEAPPVAADFESKAPAME
jgi:hypothetical protein